MKKVLAGIVLLLLIVVIGGISAVGWQVVLGPKARSVTAQTFERTEARRARGEYLVENVAACFHCHSEHDLTDPAGPIKAGMKGAGWELPIPELGRVVAPNITSDVETGIGGWTDDEIARAIQEGVNKSGAALFPIMPYLTFRNMDDEDLASIVVYLRTVPAVKMARERTKLIFPLSVLVKTMPVPLPSHAPKPAPVRATAVDRGAYLVKNLSDCAACHTPADDKGQLLPGLDFSGGGEFHNLFDNMKPIHSVNITSDPSGLAHYDEAMFIQTIRTGRAGGRQLNPIMPIENYRGMTDADLKDIFAFLQSVPKVQHRVSNTDAQTKCPLCGRTHGLGELNKAR
jgi:mono/diheme cytochrome c family protein